MGTTFGLHHILFAMGLLPLRNPHPPHTGVKVELRPEPMTYTPILGSGSSNMLEFFEFDKKISNFFCLLGLRKKNFSSAGAGATKKFFLEKLGLFLGTRPP